MPMCRPRRRPASMSSSAISRLGPISTAFQRDIAFGPDIHRVPGASPRLIGLLVAPQREAFVVLRGQRHVLGAGALEDVGPMVRLVEFGAEHGGEIEVGEAGAVRAVVEFAGGGIRLLERVPIPLGVHRLALGVDGGIRGHRVDTPVNEDAELGIDIPGRAGARIDRFPGGLIAILAEGAAAGSKRERSRRAATEKVTTSHGFAWLWYQVISQTGGAPSRQGPV